MPSRWPRTIASALLALALATRLCDAQPPPGAPAAAFKRFDAAGYLGWFRGNRGDGRLETGRDWYSTPLGAAGLGRYWTEHLKTEIEVSATGRGRLSSGEFAPIGPGLWRSVVRQHQHTVRTVSVVQSYQFLHNAWVHPFAGAGLDLDWEHRRIESQTQVYGTRSPGSPELGAEPPRIDEHTALRPRVALLAGFKAYLSREAFFRTDVRASLARGVDQVSWRFGLGLDF